MRSFIRQILIMLAGAIAVGSICSMFYYFNKYPQYGIIAGYVFAILICSYLLGTLIFAIFDIKWFDD